MPAESAAARSSPRSTQAKSCSQILLHRGGGGHAGSMMLSACLQIEAWSHPVSRKQSSASWLTDRFRCRFAGRVIGWCGFALGRVRTGAEMRMLWSISLSCQIRFLPSVRRSVCLSVSVVWFYLVWMDLFLASRLWRGLYRIKAEKRPMSGAAPTAARGAFF